MDPDARNWQRYLEMFGRALTFLKIYPLDGDDARASELAQLAIDHMLSGLDPHTHSLTPEEFEEVQSETSGEYGGVGIEITLKEGSLTVVSTFEGTPANLAGIQSGDQIVGIAGEPTDDMTLFDAVRRIRGKEGTPVVLSIMREGLSAPKEYAVQREIIHIVSVSHRSLGDEVAYIRIRTFNKATNEDLGGALRAHRNDDRKGVILDLRGNPGGLLEESIDVAGRFLRKGQLVVETRSRVPDHPGGQGECQCIGDCRLGAAGLQACADRGRNHLREGDGANDHSPERRVCTPPHSGELLQPARPRDPGHRGMAGRSGGEPHRIALKREAGPPT
jgi:C-terminal processing protease CtpA/Prc